MLKKICLCAVAIMLCACVEQKSATSQVAQKNMAPAVSFALKKASNKNVYVYVNQGGVAGIREAVEQSVNARGFISVSTPSEAGYILYISPVHSGAMSQGNTKALGDYGTPWKSTGAHDGMGFVVDVQAVSRKIPTSSRYNMVAITAATPSVLSKKAVRMVVFTTSSQDSGATPVKLLQEMGMRIAAAL